MTPEQQSLYKAAVQKVRDEVMAAVQAAEAASNGSAAGRNARARNLNQKYFSSDTESAMAPIPITKRKRGRPAKKGANGGVCGCRAAQRMHSACLACSCAASRRQVTVLVMEHAAERGVLTLCVHCLCCAGPLSCCCPAQRTTPSASWTGWTLVAQQPLGRPAARAAQAHCRVGNCLWTP